MLPVRRTGAALLLCLGFPNDRVREMFYSNGQKALIDARRVGKDSFRPTIVQSWSMYQCNKLRQEELKLGQKAREGVIDSIM